MDVLLLSLPPQAMAATASTSVNGITKRSLLFFLPEFCPVGCVLVEFPLKVSSVVDHL
jgi:hypothetical protein